MEFIDSFGNLESNNLKEKFYKLINYCFSLIKYILKKNIEKFWINNN